jgi:hypothetical protein
MPMAIKRAYEAASTKDGYRVLVDGLWPRGVTYLRTGIGVIWDADPLELPVIPAKANPVRRQHISKVMRSGFPLSRE